jgi:hypothetical protein
VKQAAGKQPIPPRGLPTFEEAEDAYRFGHGARSYYGKQYPSWNNQLESTLEQDWVGTYNDRDWFQYRNYVRRGWDYEATGEMRKAA